MSAANPLRVGYVPEHFSTPLHFAQKHFDAHVTLTPFPSGTGHMISSLAAGEIDLGIGLTEGWVAGLAKASSDPAPYHLVGTYVESPLCWAISTGAKRADIAQQTDPGEWIKDLKGRKMGVSRIGSGSYVMGFLLADKSGWISGEDGAKEPFNIVPLDTFDKLRAGVNDGEADFFMWENFTSKRYYDNGEIRKIGQIYTPWPSWHITARPEIANDPRLQEFFATVDDGIKYFSEHSDEAVEYISTQLDYSAGDAREWLKTVQFAQGVMGVRKSVIDETISVLTKAKVVAENVNGAGMVKFTKEEKGLVSSLIE